MRSEGCWPADGMIAAASPYWEFGTSRWRLEEQDISAKGSDVETQQRECSLWVIRVFPAIPAGLVLQKFLAAHSAAHSMSASLRE